jgi:hypothetical protein
MWGGQVFVCYRTSAAKAKNGFSIFESVSNRDLMMKNKTLAFPLALVRFDFLEIIQDASPEMINLVKSILQEVR